MSAFANTAGSRPIHKLEIGAGENPIVGGFTHNDLVAYPHIEIVASGSDMPMIPPDSVHMVRAMHVLEHFSQYGAIEALREWRRILVMDGILELALPNGEMLVHLWATGQLSFEAMIRDMVGLPSGAYIPPSEAAFRQVHKQHGWSFHLKEWLYTPMSQLPCGNSEGAQTHRWAYGASDLERLLVEFGFYRVHVKIDGTALHAWGSKQPIRRKIGFDELQRLFKDQPIAADD